MPALITDHLRAAVAAALACAALGVLAGCGEETLDAGSAESEIEKKGEEQGVKVKDAKCPDDIKAKKGEKATCKATVDGQEVDVKLTMLDDEGKFEFELQAP